mmetsp:Transcript_39297/g.77300  ORF Transcript_39297/g.77300 Transcript_39297/m.77300 type:complete len:360 (+) Transcript_39297:32-1111(+)|eukprot:CAMPEP_0175130074 /NCGR_PEP_ID=MMETSP0087-20121206/5813_1 /TAXON_ID=136419 /ORGANISM="Unknown Unknown, Strain D1" /LENGTH=359 /DNA_ID=CAMNT_0016412269 /DNA_START=31 /DNA_END=1110 /DNA_ORIENTATION=-
MMSEQEAQASKCIQIARNSWVSGDQEKALKFLEKSLRLHPTAEAQELLRKISCGESPTSSNPPRSPPPQQAQPRPRSKPDSTPRQTKNYTDEEESMARKIKRSTDYYQILNVPRNAEETQIKKAYRTLAKAFHPDKNKAPSAEEAFKKITAAYSCLMDPQRRRYYNQTGSEDPGGGGGGGRRGTREYDFAEPQDIFDAFFGGGFAHPRARRARRPRQRQQEDQAGPAFGFGTLLNFLPLLFMLLFAIPDSGSRSEPFSLEKDSDFSLRRTTHHNTDYFVTRNFDMYYSSDHRYVAQIEARVDQQYFEKLQTECEAEKVMQSKLLRAAKQTKGPALPAELYKAYSFELESCERLAAVTAF